MNKLNDNIKFLVTLLLSKAKLRLLSYKISPFSSNNLSKQTSSSV